MWFGVVPAGRMKFVAASGVNMRLVTESLAHVGNTLLVPASFGHSFALGP
jgi:hypothetical protein